MDDRGSAMRFCGLRRPNKTAAALAVVAVVAVVAAVSFTIVNLRVLPPPGAAEPFYKGTVELESRADFIVRATILRTTERDRGGTSETVATLLVRKSAKGDAAEGATIEVTYTTPGSGPAETPEGLEQGNEYVFLLEHRPGSGTNLISTVQGYYFVVDNRAVADRDNPVMLSAATRNRLGLL